MRARRRQSQIPTVNLVPMMDVLMTVLTFFIIISMSLTGQQLKNVTLPSLAKDVSGLKKATVQGSTMEVGLDQKGTIIFQGKPVTSEDLKIEVLEYLVANPAGAVVLKADRKLPYQKVAKLLGQLNTIGGGQVSLVVEQQ